MAAKKKSDSNSKSDGTRGINYKGKEIKFDSKPRPVKESFSQGGGPVPKVAAGAKKTLSLPAPKTKVVKATDQLAGGSPLGTSIAVNPLNKGQVTGAASTVVGSKGSGKIAKKVGEKVGGFVSGHSFDAASRGLSGATGMGGKIKTVTTPFGKTVAGTKVGSAAEQSARIENLYAAAAKTSTIAGTTAAKQVARNLGRVGNAARMGAASAVVVSGSKKVTKTRKK